LSSKLLFLINIEYYTLIGFIMKEKLPQGD